MFTTGTVTGLIPTTGDSPDRCNVKAKGGDLLRVIIPGWMTDCRVGDLVDLNDEGHPNTYVVTVNRTRRGTKPSVGPVFDFATTAPAGATQVDTFWQMPDSTPTAPHLRGVYPAPPIPNPGQRFVKVLPVGSATWDPSNKWFDSKVRQGSFGTGRNYGLYFYPDLTAQLAGLTITRIEWHVTRFAGVNGRDGAVPLHVWMHNLTGVPTVGGVVNNAAPAFASETVPGVAPSKGASVDPTLDVTVYAAALQSGAQKGFGISDAADDTYMALLEAGSATDPLTGQLTFYY